MKAEQNSTEQNSHLILAVGEVLWDLLPNPAQGTVAPAHGTDAPMQTRDACTQRRDTSRGAGPMKLLGGAPANFSVMAGRLGNRSVLLSRVGGDALGRMAVDRLRTLPVETEFIQTGRTEDTGRVDVSLTNGQPSYRIHQPVAWDFMESSREWLELAEHSSAICFGSLAQRSPQSRRCIQEMVAATGAGCERVFDVNLRAPFYSDAVVHSSIGLATMVKMNDEEVGRVLDLVGIPPPEGTDLKAEQGIESATDWLRQAAERLLDRFARLDLVAITRGDQGSVLVRRTEWDVHPGILVVVADTIGSGDAFTAALIHYRLRGASLAQLNEAGNRWGSWVASQAGAMPVLSDEVREQLTALIEG